MCHFISWIEYADKVYFLDDNKLNTKEGRELLKADYADDILGHGAIRHYYPELHGRGKDCECVDFSSPKNFPPEIVKAIKKGWFSNFSVCEDIIFKKALEQKKAYAEWEKADAEWKKVYAEWEKAYAEWEKADAERKKAYAERKKAYAEWEKADAERKKAYAERKKVYAEWEKADAEREKAYAEWEKADRIVFWKIARQKKNRKKVWK